MKKRRTLGVVAASLLLSALTGTELIDHHVFASQAQVMPKQIVTERKFPWPYKAMLAIESDADHTDLRKFNIIHEFLNTKDETILGRGLGLDISDSFFLYNGSNEPQEIDYNGATVKDEMTMFQGTSHDPSIYAPILLYYIRHGWIDTFHSAGDFSRVNSNTTLFSRSLEAYAMEFLKKEHVPAITIFTDHGNRSNVANFGSYTPFDHYMEGDNPKSPYYITDLLEHEGVQFVWSDHFGDQYSYKTMLYPITLRDGTKMWGFYRFTGTRKVIFLHHHRDAVADWDNMWNPTYLWEQLSPERLDQLVKSGGYTVIATHLEGNANEYPLNQQTIEALVHLAHMQDHGLILVARTSRLLQYNLVQQGLQYRVFYNNQNGITEINITEVRDPVDGNFIPTWEQLRGITFHVENPSYVTLTINGVPVPDAELVRSAHTIGIRWYTPDTTNWAVTVGSPLYHRLEVRMEDLLH
ncbi:hypothetical protein [Sulfoacidibacillus thermotolerans]|uniref:Uncharacterized protein n=1 Tax=Sulfoacidibacillus thermotolerans TaxID=1765684 RepID=A0A2U3D6Y8_SULT2|nr:hypothetical protein [Sulfoacidibacillus thermotolerans]PWI57045.1 hypothetical protein BM613_10335 [Sulfoacidibacillus thermotolerans]